MVLPGWKTMVFFAIMAVVGAILHFMGIDVNTLPPEIQEMLTEEHINELTSGGYKIGYWIIVVGGFFFRLITKSPVFKKD